MIPNIGPMEIAIVLVIALVIFGPKRLPELGSSLGKGIRGFGHSLKGEDSVAEIEAAEPSPRSPAERRIDEEVHS